MVVIVKKKTVPYCGFRCSLKCQTASKSEILSSYNGYEEQPCLLWYFTLRIGIYEGKSISKVQIVIEKKRMEIMTRK